MGSQNQSEKSNNNLFLEVQERKSEPELSTEFTSFEEEHPEMRRFTENDNSVIFV